MLSENRIFHLIPSFLKTGMGGEAECPVWNVQTCFLPLVRLYVTTAPRPCRSLDGRFGGLGSGQSGFPCRPGSSAAQMGIFWTKLAMRVGIPRHERGSHFISKWSQLQASSLLRRNWQVRATAGRWACRCGKNYRFARKVRLVLLDPRADHF